MARQRDEIRATADQLASALGRLLAHSDNSPLAFVEFDPEFRLIAWSKGAERIFGWRAHEVVGQKVTDLRWVHEDDTAEFAALSADILAGKQPRGINRHRNYRKDGSIVECEWYTSILLDPNGRLISINSQILDITERKRAEETQQLLIGELNHRVRNTLATVQAIATQTLRHSGNPLDFTANFSGRIQSLARAHSLLSNDTLRGANLTELVQDQLRMGALDETRLLVSGPAVRLTPQAALHLAMILHELGTNARKYGALSTAHGQVVLNWTVDDDKLCLSWVERGGPAAKAPTKRGFGTTLIERSAKAEDGAAHASYRADGVAWEITFPLPQLQLLNGAERLPAAIVQTGQHRPGAKEGLADRLSGRRFLIIEDEPLVALELASVLEDAGAIVVGSAGTAGQALQIIENTMLDGALLDGNLRGRAVDDIAAALTRRSVPFLFVSGYGKENLPKAFSGAAVLAKPITHSQLLEAAIKLVPPSGEVLLLKRQDA